MLPGLSRMQWAPASIAFSARVWLKWMSAITGIGESLDDRLQRLRRPRRAAPRRGPGRRRRRRPSSICSIVASRLAVSVLVIVCTATGAPPPIGTPPTKIWRLEAIADIVTAGRRRPGTFSRWRHQRVLAAVPDLREQDHQPILVGPVRLTACPRLRAPRSRTLAPHRRREPVAVLAPVVIARDDRADHAAPRHLAHGRDHAEDPGRHLTLSTRSRRPLDIAGSLAIRVRSVREGGIAAPARRRGGAALRRAGAQANFHLMKISEVATNPAAPGDGVHRAADVRRGPEPRRRPPGQLLHRRRSCRSRHAAAPTSPNGDNQRTILIGDTARAGPPTSSLDQSRRRAPTLGAGGAVCFDTDRLRLLGRLHRQPRRCPRQPARPAPAITDGSALDALDRARLRDPARGRRRHRQQRRRLRPRGPIAAQQLVAPDRDGAAAAAATTRPARRPRSPRRRRRSRRRPRRSSSSARRAGLELHVQARQGRSSRTAPRRSRSRIDAASTSSRSSRSTAAGNDDPSPAKAKFKRVER